MKNCKKCGKKLYNDNKTGYCASCLKEKTNALRLICPNCDSQLDTFKSKNKKSARNR